MHINDLLEEKWKTQRRMAAEADYNIKKMLDNAEKSVEEMTKEHGITLKYAKLRPSWKMKKVTKTPRPRRPG